jgi:hypothetical protein
MYMLAMVSSGSSVRIFIILGNLMILGQLLRDCKSTTKCCNHCCIYRRYIGNITEILWGPIFS